MSVPKVSLDIAAHRRQGIEPVAIGNALPSFSVRLTSAMGSSVVSAVATTPFDVVKTRLQVFDRATSCAFSSSVRFQHVVCCQPTSNGSLFLGANPRPSAYRMMACIVKNEGLTSLWRGTGYAMLTSLPSVGIYLTCYEQLKHHLQARMEKGKYFAPIVAGSVSRTLAVVMTNPLELVRTQIMAQRGTSRGNAGGRVLMSQAMQSGGVLSLWRGVIPTLYRDVPFSATYWLVAEMSRDSLAAKLGASLPTKNRNKLENVHNERIASASDILWVNLASGMIAGSAAALLTHPFDVIKTRIQVEITHGIKEETDMKTLSILRRMIQAEGWVSLWGGVGPRVLKVAPSCAIVLGTYEMLKYVWAEGR
uniref:Mitochondrial carrier protein n=1 Tax=Guillardia theta TaxID=55529 RepID=A0A7S4URS4_GUITH|mmetsp:Transcript_44312/g.139813  ORF Transcript_44312/g.139813 Transcript_44312/m.139813 type:complete len:364 (+) Transcript_44312:533-1624(+)